MTRTTMLLCGVFALVGCGGRDEATSPAPSTSPPSSPAAAARPPVVALGSPTTVAYPGAAADVEAESTAASLTLTIADAGWYQCRAHAEGRDAQLALLQGGAEIARDSDSGGNFDALVVRELASGTYELRVWEWRREATPIVVTCTSAPRPAAVGALVLGAPTSVSVPAASGPPGQREFTLAIPTSGPYTCDAHADGNDAQIAILSNGSTLQEDSDSGDGVDARISRELAAGDYVVRVWEWGARAATITVRCYPGLTPPGT